MTIADLSFDPANPAILPSVLDQLPLTLAQANGTADTVGAPGGPAGDPATDPGTEVPGWWGLVAGPFVPLILLLLVFWFFILSGNRKKEKQRQEMLSGLVRGDRVTTIGGMLGTVLDADAESVTLKVDENNNTKIRFTRGAIANVTRASSQREKGEEKSPRN